MRPRPLVLAALLTAFAGPSASAASLLAGFDSPEYTVDNVAADVAGQNGWTIDDATPDLSFFVAWAYLGSAEGNHGAAVGAYLDSPVEPRVELANSYVGPLVDSLTSLKFSIQPSTTDFPGTDTFGFTYRDSDSASLFTLSLEPNPSFADRAEVVWYDAANTRTPTGLDIFYGGAYDLALAFSGSGPNATFAATLTGSETVQFAGTLPDVAGATISTFGASISRDPAAVEYGDNYLVFDTLSIQPVIPEPASALLAAAGLLLVVRRRR